MATTTAIKGQGGGLSRRSTPLHSHRTAILPLISSHGSYVASFPSPPFCLSPIHSFRLLSSSPLLRLFFSSLAAQPSLRPPLLLSSPPQCDQLTLRCRSLAVTLPLPPELLPPTPAPSSFSSSLFHAVCLSVCAARRSVLSSMLVLGRVSYCARAGGGGCGGGGWARRCCGGIGDGEEGASEGLCAGEESVGRRVGGERVGGCG